MNMAKYDKIFNSEEFAEEIELTEAEGLAAIVVIAVLADDPKELVAPDLFLDILADFDLYATYSDEDMLALVDRLTAIAVDEGMGVLFNAADEAISDELVPDAYLAAVLAMTDPNTGEVLPNKQIFLNELQAILDIDDDEASALLAEIQVEEGEEGETVANTSV
jgi:hypothetical protein